MSSLTKTTNSFNERHFLIRSLVAIFIIQFMSTGAQFVNCFTLSNSSAETERANLICSQANSSFSETGKLALTTLLALLVPPSQVASGGAETVTRRRKTTEESQTPE